MNSELYSSLIHVHSIGRWLLLLLLLIAIFNSLTKRGMPFSIVDKQTGTGLMIVADLMVLVGLILWYLGALRQIKAIGMADVMQNNVMRFFAIEHPVGMLIALALIHIGRRQGKKKIPDASKHKRTLIYYLIALIIIVISIPWPFLNNGTNGHWY